MAGRRASHCEKQTGGNGDVKKTLDRLRGFRGAEDARGSGISNVPRCDPSLETAQFCVLSQFEAAGWEFGDDLSEVALELGEAEGR